MVFAVDEAWTDGRVSIRNVPAVCEGGLRRSASSLDGVRLEMSPCNRRDGRSPRSLHSPQAMLASFLYLKRESAV
jgi:hypothetical protein